MAEAPDPLWCGDRIRYWAETRPERIALTEPGRTLSYRATEDKIAEAETLLARAGLRAGDRLLIVCENSLATGIAITAAQRMRAWPVPLNARLTVAEVANIAAHARPRLAVVTDGISAEAKAHAAALGVSTPFLDLGASMGALPDPGAPEPVTGDPAHDIAALIYTTGTTGAPKGVMLSHRNLTFAASTLARIRQADEHEHVYCPLPLAHIFGLGAVLGTALHVGYRADFVPRFDPAETLRAFAEDGVTMFSGVPAMYAAMVALGEARGGVEAPALRYITSGGAPLDPGLKARVEALFGLPLANGWGLTETSPLGAVTPFGEPSNDLSVGPPLDGVDLRVVGPDGRDVDEGEVGELWLRGPFIMRGYYRAPELTAGAITPEGWFRTGDLGRVDARGWIYIAGRSKELIIRSGFNIYPPEVEGVLTKHPSIALAAVVGRKTSDGNEDVLAFLQLKPGKDVELAELQALAARELAPYKRPAEYHVHAALPAAATGKILKHRLLDLLET